MSKYQVKVGQDFDPQQQMKVSVEVTISASEEKKEKSGLFADWRSQAVVGVFVLAAALGTYAVITGDMTLVDRILDTAAKVKAEHPKGKNDGKES